MTEPTADDAWLKDENPDLYLILHALAGEGSALRRLESVGRGLALFALALAGNRKALAALEAGGDLELDYVHGLAVNCQQIGWLAEHHPELYALFEAIKGNEGPLRRFQGKKAGLRKLARIVRTAAAEDAETGGTPDPSAADVGCLVGELHLNKREYAKAVEAFTRSLLVSPTADAFEGRAKAYRGLAADDERRARELEGAGEQASETPAPAGE